MLQTLVAEHPEMLAGDEAHESGRQRWLLIERESPISEEEGLAGRWSADHLFIDQDGVPTVVETKRSSDPRARREVVAQMLGRPAPFVVCLLHHPLYQGRSRAESEPVREQQNLTISRAFLSSPPSDSNRKPLHYK
jgi:hypothetical protein